MRPALLLWLQLLATVKAAAAAETTTAAPTAAVLTPASATPTAAAPTAAVLTPASATPTAAAPTAAVLTPASATPTAASTPHPLASLFFPNAGQFRAFDSVGAVGGGRAGEAVPWLAGLARSLPTQMRAFEQPAQSREAVSAIEEFTGPLVRFATGGRPVAADVEQLIDSIPHLARSANALKEVDKVNLSSMDFTSLPSALVAHVLNGGAIPGIDQKELDRVVREQLKKMSETADRLLRGEQVDNVEKILPPLNKVPMEMVMSSLQGKTLPGLTSAETTKIREYYTKQLPSQLPADADTASPLPESLSALGEMVRLLPPGYDIGRIPPEFIQSMLSGRVPDLKLLPADLQAYMGAGRDQAMSIVKSLNSSVSEIVAHLAATVQQMPAVERAAAYDISKVTHEVIDVEADKAKQTRNVLYTITWVAVAFAIATIVVIWLLYKKFANDRRKPPSSAPTPPARVLVDHLIPRDPPAFSPETIARMIGATSPTRRRNAAAVPSPDAQAKLEFAAKACRFSTPKPQLVLEDSPEVPKKEEKEDVEVEKRNSLQGDKVPAFVLQMLQGPIVPVAPVPAPRNIQKADDDAVDEGVADDSGDIYDDTTQEGEEKE